MGIERKHIGDNKAPLLPLPPTQKKRIGHTCQVFSLTT